MKRIVLSLLLCAVVLGGFGCVNDDPIADQWTHNLYPDSNGSYVIGSNGSPYFEGHFTNLYANMLYLTGSIINGTTIATTGNFTDINVTNNGSFGNISVTNNISGSNLTLSGNITAYGIILTAPLLIIAPVWEDMRIVTGSFDRPGVTDPAYIEYAPNGSTITTYLTEWAKNDFATATIQLPHAYKEGTDIYCHIHWTAGAKGVTENGKAVGWKVSYTWANMDANFGNMSTLNLSDVCDGVNHKHQMTPDVLINGSGKTISSMLLLNIIRSDTGADDTWSGSTSGNLPLMLEMDLHYQIDTLGSRQILVK